MVNKSVRSEKLELAFSDIWRFYKLALEEGRKMAEANCPNSAAVYYSMAGAIKAQVRDIEP